MYCNAYPNDGKGSCTREEEAWAHELDNVPPEHVDCVEKSSSSPIHLAMLFVVQAHSSCSAFALKYYRAISVPIATSCSPSSPGASGATVGSPEPAGSELPATAAGMLGDRRHVVMLMPGGAGLVRLTGNAKTKRSTALQPKRRGEKKAYRECTGGGAKSKPRE